MIAVTFALPAESSEFIRLLRDRRGNAGTLHQHQIRVLHTGVGEKAARTSIVPFLESESPRLLISCGFAGALADELAIADLFLADNFSEPQLAANTRAVLSTLNLRSGVLATSQSIADSAADRETLRRSGASAVDMETAVIHEACARHNIPLLSLRAISDTPAHPLGIPAPVLFDVERQQTNAARLAAHIIRHPLTIRELIALARNVKQARRSLAAALELLFRGKTLLRDC